ncbi:MAG: hypothetical protein JXK95_05340 [Bacteroidales bacterium]|nr:hypothetical protein [Bacteroidales bacterium]
MIAIDIPGYKKIKAEHLVLDFNGTIAVDGKLIYGLKEQLELLSHKLCIHIITADTFGTVNKELEGIACNPMTIPVSDQDMQKERYVSGLGSERVIAIGNGQNDVLMLRKSALGIMVIQQEGAFGKLFNDADIVCFSIHDALDLLLNPLRVIATMRK